jgi:hypothetical protein
MTDPHVFSALIQLDREKALDACTRLINIDENIMPIVLTMLREHDFNNLESLSHALLASDNLCEARINALTLISRKQGLLVNQINDCMRGIQKNFTTDDPLLIPSLEFLVSVSHEIDIELLSLLPRIAIDSDENVASLVDTVMRRMFNHWPVEYIGKLLCFEKEGYIASSHYLGKFIL